MKKVYLETYGCQMNVSDSERVASQLAESGYSLTETEETADIILLNTCSVREKAEQKLFTRAGQFQHAEGPKKIIGVMGCVAQLEGESLLKGGRGIDFVIGTKAVGRVGKAIDSVVKTRKTYVDLGEREEDYEWLPLKAQRHSQHIAFVPIIEGCNKFCTYCIVPFSRGREKSLLASEIIRQVLELRREGVKEVHLIGQNVNSYRPLSDSGMETVKGATPFSRLLRAVAATGIERLKFTTSFPRDYHPDITDAINEHENLCNWVHLPVQSGSDSILRAMRRGHTVDSYKKKIDSIRSSSKNISISTDLIIGFPGETDEDFRATCDLFEYCEYDFAYLFKYSPRPGTPADEMEDDVSHEEKKSRFLELEKIQKRCTQASFERKKGTVLEVLIEKAADWGDGRISGHSTCQVVVNTIGPKSLIGSIVDVKITKTKANTLFGEIRQ